MKRRIVFAVAIALVTVTFSVFAQQRNQAENRQRLDEQENRYENQGGRQGRVDAEAKAAVAEDYSDCWILTATAICPQKR